LNVSPVGVCNTKVNWLDYLLLAILLFSAAMSARRGFSREIIGLAATILALVLGMWFYGIAGSYIAPYTGSPQLANFLGFILVCAGVLLAGAMLGWIVKRFIRTVGLSFFDRLLGAAFGILRGLLIAMILLTAFMAFTPYLESDRASSAVVHSRIAPFVLDASHFVVAMAPMEMKSAFQERYTSLKSTLEKKNQVSK
jgi:membrane protein required for colicin V production